MIITECRSYERRLPHHRCENAIYFVTWRVHKRQMPLTEDERTTVAATLEFNHNRRYSLIAYVVMDDHVHALLWPRTGETVDRILHTWKSYTANRLQRNNDRERSVWQDESYDRKLHSQSELCTAMEYIRNNPVKRWPDCEEYPWMRVLAEESLEMIP